MLPSPGASMQKRSVCRTEENEIPAISAHDIDLLANAPQRSQVAIRSLPLGTAVPCSVCDPGLSWTLLSAHLVMGLVFMLSAMTSRLPALLLKREASAAE